MRASSSIIVVLYTALWVLWGILDVGMAGGLPLTAGVLSPVCRVQIEQDF